jgi:hypothetical protein
MFNSFIESCALYNNVGRCSRAKCDTVDNVIERMRCTYWIHKTTKTHAEYVICIAFPQQQWLTGRASLSRHKYIACIGVPCKGSCRHSK